MLDGGSTPWGSAGSAWAEKLGLLRIAKKSGPRRVRTGLALFDTYKWRYGVDTVEGILEVAKQAHLDPSRITCPRLVSLPNRSTNSSG